MSEHVIQTRINGQDIEARIEARVSLGDFLRRRGLTGTHLACEHGVCGACTVTLDGDAVRSCLMFAVQADGAEIVTVEGVANEGSSLHPVQQAMRESHALQCGFCTPGVVMTLYALCRDGEPLDEETALKAMSGHLCRCTGYQGIRKAIAKLAGNSTGDMS